jgi:hypothetical protein
MAANLPGPFRESECCQWVREEAIELGVEASLDNGSGISIIVFAVGSSSSHDLVAYNDLGDGNMSTDLEDWAYIYWKNKRKVVSSAGSSSSVTRPSSLSLNLPEKALSNHSELRQSTSLRTLNMVFAFPGAGARMTCTMSVEMSLDRD